MKIQDMLIVALVAAFYYGFPVVDRMWFRPQRQTEREKTLDSYFQLKTLATEIKTKEQEVEAIGRKIRSLNSTYMRIGTCHSPYGKLPDDAKNEAVWCQELQRSIAERNRLVALYNSRIQEADPVFRDPGLRLVGTGGEKLDLLTPRFSELTQSNGCLSK